LDVDHGKVLLLQKIEDAWGDQTNHHVEDGHFDNGIELVFQ
jgi:hypothetical protein